MNNYLFLASDIRLPTFADMLEQAQIKSYNELLALGLTDKQINRWGLTFRQGERDAKIFYMPLPDEVASSALIVEQDEEFAYFARFLTPQKYIYRVRYAEQSVAHVYAYITPLMAIVEKLALWHVALDDYGTVTTQHTVRFHALTLEHVEAAIAWTTPYALIIHK